MNDVRQRAADQSEHELARQIAAAEADYLTCLAQFGHHSAEALSANWVLCQLKRRAKR